MTKKDLPARGNNKTLKQNVILELLEINGLYYKKKKDVPTISEEKWLNHFQSLHSSKPINPIQREILHELRLLESQKEQLKL